MSAIEAREILAYVGGAALERYGTLARRPRRTGRGGDDNPFVYSRSNAAWGVDVDGTIRPVAAGAPRLLYYDLDGDGVREPLLLLEPAATNLVTEAEDLSQWTPSGTPVVTDDQVAHGVLNLAEVEDDNGAGVEYVELAVSLTGDTQKGVSVFVKAGTATTTRIVLRDTGAAADRLNVDLAWSGGVPTPTANTGEVLVTRDDEDGVYRIEMLSTAVTAANPHTIRILPAGATGGDTGTVYIGGVQVEDTAFCTSYIPTDGGTAGRSVDVASVVFPYAPRAMSLYARFLNIGSNLTASTVARVLHLGALGANTAPRLEIYWGGSAFEGYHNNGSSNVTGGNPSGTPDEYDLVELLLTLGADGAVQLSQSLNGGSVTTGSASSALALAAAWAGDPVLQLNQMTSDGIAAYHAIIAARGAHTIPEFRELVA